MGFTGWSRVKQSQLCHSQSLLIQSHQSKATKETFKSNSCAMCPYIYIYVITNIYIWSYTIIYHYHNIWLIWLQLMHTYHPHHPYSHTHAPTTSMQSTIYAPILHATGAWVCNTIAALHIQPGFPEIVIRIDRPATLTIGNRWGALCDGHKEPIWSFWR